MKIDMSGFAPRKNIMSSNFDINHALEEASAGYIKQIQNEAVIIDHNLKKITALHELKTKCSDLLITTINEINAALWQKNAFIEPEGYFLAEVIGDTTDMSFSIKNIKLAQPQYINFQPWPSATEEVVGMKDGLMNIALKSFLTVEQGIVTVADSTIVQSMHFDFDLFRDQISIGPFHSPTPTSMAVMVGDQKFTAFLSADEIVEEVTFSNRQGNNFTLQLSESLTVQEAVPAFNEGLKIDAGVDVMILSKDSLQTIATRLNRLGQDRGFSSYILRSTDNQYHLTIKATLGQDIIISGDSIPDYTTQPAIAASLVVNDQLITAIDNKFELLVGGLSIHLTNNSPNKQVIQLSIEADLALMVRVLENFSHRYNVILDFYSENTAKDILGGWQETAILRDSSALDITKSQLRNATLQRVNNRSLTDFGILFDDKSHLKIDALKLINALIEEGNRHTLSQLIGNFTGKLQEILHYNGPINKELDHTWRNNDIQNKKIDHIEKKIHVTQSNLYRKLSNLEAQISTANNALRLLDSKLPT